MGKRRWNIRALQALLLLVTFCLILRASAKSTPPVPPAKGEAGAPAKRGKSRSVAKTSVRNSDGKSAVRAQRSRRARSRTTAKSAARSERRHGRRKTVASIPQKVRLDTLSGSPARPFPEDDQAAAGPPSFSAETAPFLIRLNDERLPYRIHSVFALPAERLNLEVEAADGPGAYLLQAASEVTQTGPNTWLWQAPRKAGLYPMTILRPATGEAVVLNVFVMVPFSQLASGYVNGYRVGNYPRSPFKFLPIYHLPQGFVEVTPANEDVLVSPHFRLRQFLCKQEGEYPKYLVLDARLLLVLESVLQKVNDTGYRCPTFAIMSGYRTPYYNRAIGNPTTYSRHTLGDAADIFIDASPEDGEMDDLNRDGVVNFRDSTVLYNIVNKMYEPRARHFFSGEFLEEPRVQQFLAGGLMSAFPLQQLLTGGLARYRQTSAHGPFVHVDVRGIYTRWGE